MASESCEKREAAARIAVAHPEQLARDPWAAHLRECAECRDVSRGFAQSLAVYRQVELERLSSRREFGPTWEQFANTLRGEPRYRRVARRYRLPVAAAAVSGLLLFTSASVWISELDSAPEAPARIVRLEPDQKQKMQQLVGQSLSGSGGTGAGIAITRPAPRLTPVEPIASEEVTPERNRLYASGDRALPVQPVIRRNHPFVDGGEVAVSAEDVPMRPSRQPVFPVISRPRTTEIVSFPVFMPGGR